MAIRNSSRFPEVRQIGKTLALRVTPDCSLLPSHIYPASHVRDYLVGFFFVSSLEALAHRDALLSVPLVEEKGLTSLATSAVSSDK